jgi:large subunit ribosomal protein L35
MPKLKRKSGAKKKFKVTGTGKLTRRKAGQSHNLGPKSPKLKRSFSKELPVSPDNTNMVKRLLGKR